MQPLADNIRRRSELRNVPRICDSPYFTSCQVNITPTVSLHSNESLEAGGLGSAGCPHCDGHDHASSITFMTANSDLPEGMHEGLFFLIEFGCYVHLVNHRLVGFCGLHFHGGQPPRPVSEDAVPPKWATRVTIIWYPSHSIMERLGVCALINSAKGMVETRAHPSLGVPAPSPPVDENTNAPPLAFYNDGPSCMKPADLCRFLTREFYCYIQNKLSHIDGVELSFDQKQWMSSISMKDENTGQFVPLEWPLGPDRADTEDERSQAMDEFRDMHKQHVMTIPSMLKDIDLVDDISAANPNSESSPSL